MNSVYNELSRNSEIRYLRKAVSSLYIPQNTTRSQGRLSYGARAAIPSTHTSVVSGVHLDKNNQHDEQHFVARELGGYDTWTQSVPSFEVIIVSGWFVPSFCHTSINFS